MGEAGNGGYRNRVQLWEEQMSFGQFIAKRRKYLRLTQEELADRIGVSKSAVAKWETDGGLPDRDNLRRLSEIMNVSVDDLHRIIDNRETESIDRKINITPDVIATLESYGYQVIRPDEKEEKG
ncbi:MAG: helix-turn-helix domain-containing protein [Lachnospiraceae bacterium]|nr:helix-turn-helix domain-containing protein [Lachnospiraceae bacterium]